MPVAIVFQNLEAGARRVEHRSTRETILGCPPIRLWFLKGRVLLRLRFSLANFSFGLVRHYRPALHDSFHLINRHIDIRERV